SYQIRYVIRAVSSKTSQTDDHIDFGVDNLGNKIPAASRDVGSLLHALIVQIDALEPQLPPHDREIYAETLQNIRILAAHALAGRSDLASNSTTSHPPSC